MTVSNFSRFTTLSTPSRLQVVTGNKGDPEEKGAGEPSIGSNEWSLSHPKKYEGISRSPAQGLMWERLSGDLSEPRFAFLKSPLPFL